MAAPRRPVPRPLEPASRALAALALVAALASGARAARMELFVPAYAYPTPGAALWDSLAAAAPRLPVTVIASPDTNGPGALVDPDYTAALGAVRAAGARVLGYVNTSYGTRPLAAVETQIDRWPAFYAVDGLFVDEMSNDTSAATVEYYAALYAHARALAPGWTVVGNPGTATAEVYLTRPCADVLMTFESGAGYRATPPAPWCAAHPPGAFVNLVHSAPSADSMRAWVRLAAARGVGRVFVTDDTMPNPYDRVPAYWSEEIALLATLDVPLAVPPPVAATAAALRAWPSPSRGTVWLERGGAAGPATALVTDVAGRRVRRLRWAAGAMRLAWDGRDEAGRLVPPGLYLAALERGGAAARIVRTR